MSKNIFYTIIILFAIVLGTGTALGIFKTPEKIPDDGIIACTADAKMCPDGSYVGRTGPQCEFAACPGAKSGGSVTGQVTLSPTCPVERDPPDPKCAPKAYVTTVIALQKETGKVSGEFETNSNGEYFLDLPIGTYTIRAKSGAVFPRCEDREVTVTTGAHLVIDISCDSGIR